MKALNEYFLMVVCICWFGFICLELKLHVMSSCEEGDCWINWSDQFYLNPVHLAVDTLEML